MDISFNVGSYDDTFSFANFVKSDLEIMLIEPGMYSSRDTDEVLKWFYARLNVLRELTSGPILVLSWFDGIFENLIGKVTDKPGIFYSDLRETARNEGINFRDERNYRITGSPISPSAEIFIAKELSCRWIPALLQPRVKALVLDLDNTLYSGVLGEDGSNGIKYSNAHVEFHTALKELKSSGVILSLLSKNEKEDVLRLFDERKDFYLQLEDFTAIQISWDKKSKGIERIAKELNIGTDAILFIDDNIGELAEVSSQFPGVKTMLADPLANTSTDVLNFFPGLWAWDYDSDDLSRIADMEANKERLKISRSSISVTDYLKTLNTRIVFSHDCRSNITRLASLSNKTNQFNLNLMRVSEVVLSKYLEDEARSVISVSLGDDLSDSGIIALVVAEMRKAELYIHELCISCRALGRGLENTIIFGAIGSIKGFQSVEDIVFMFKSGPRNGPALDWLAEISGALLVEHKESIKVKPKIWGNFPISDSVSVSVQRI
jgi:FkbH-like protein